MRQILVRISNLADLCDTRGVKQAADQLDLILGQSRIELQLTKLADKLNEQGQQKAAESIRDLLKRYVSPSKYECSICDKDNLRLDEVRHKGFAIICDKCAREESKRLQLEEARKQRKLEIQRLMNPEGISDLEAPLEKQVS